jgi:RND family efflux transporter MFP subunit
MNRISLPMLALVLATATACSPASAAPRSPESPPTPVRLASIERARRAPPVHATGVLASKTELRASFKVGGLIAQLAVDEGDTIRVGQVLARLTTTEIDAGVEQSRQGLTKAERDVARVTELWQGKAATREQLDDARTAAAVSRAQVRAAEFNRGHAVIRAGFNGRVLRRLVEVGELVGAGQPILLVSDEDSGWVVRVGLADRDVVRVTRGDQATLQLAAYPGARLTATVTEIASAAAPPFGTYEVELRVPSTTESVRLLSGLITSVTIEPSGSGQLAEVGLIPAVAVRDGDGRAGEVWVPDGHGGVAHRAVQIAYFDGERIAIASGLDGVASVITDGAAYLDSSSRITVTEGAMAQGDAQ